MPNKQIQSLTVDGVTYDIVDNTSGYINAQYIENKTDYEIPVSRVGEIVVGETAIGTDSTNFPTSKAVVDYVDERVVQEIDAIDVGITKIKANGTNLPINSGVVNIPVVGPNQSVGLMTSEYINNIYDSIPYYTSDLYNDSGFITSETDPTVPAWAKASTKPTYTANEVGALPSDTVITDEKLKVSQISDNGTYYPILTSNSTEAQTKLRYSGLNFAITGDRADLSIGSTTVSAPKMGRLSLTKSTYYTTIEPSNNGHSNTITLPNKTGTVALLDDIPTVPTNISSFTNDSGYLTVSDIASVMTYKGTKANYAALPSSGNTTGDVWHLTDTGAEWAWDGNAWQELGTAIDLSGYATKATTLGGYGITDAKIQNGTITLGSNTITPLTSYTETDPVFNASAAAGITSTDISNWNAKVSDTGEWNGVSLSKNSTITQTSPIYVPYLIQTSSSSAALLLVVSDTTGVSAANKIPKYNNSGYLVSTTPSANDNSTKVATTAYVDAAIPKVYSSTNTGGYLTMATLPIYDGTVV